MNQEKPRKKSAFTIVIGLMMIGSTMFTLIPQSAQAMDLAGGTIEWPAGHVVAGNENYSNGVIICSGSGLVIPTGTSLLLENVTLKINCTVPGEFAITVDSGAWFNVTNASVITAYNVANNYNFWMNGNMNLVNQSIVEECGLSTFGVGSNGVQLGPGSIMYMDNSTVRNGGRYGIYGIGTSPNHCSLNITNHSLITGNGRHGIWGNIYSHIYINESIIDFNAGIGVQSQREADIRNSEISNNSMYGLLANNLLYLFNTRISDNIQSGIYSDYLRPPSSLADSIIYNNGHGVENYSGMYLGSLSDITLDNVTISQNARHGLELHGDDCVDKKGYLTVNLENCNMSSNYFNGLNSSYAKTNIRNSTFNGNGQSGLWGSGLNLSRNSQLMAWNCTINDNLDDGITCNGISNYTLSNVTLSQNGRDGLFSVEPEQYAGVRTTNGTSKVAYISFGFEGISNGSARDNLMANTINWLEPSLASNVLLVDDDSPDRLGTHANFESYYNWSLDNATIGHDYWETSSQGIPPIATLASYPVVIWFTGLAYPTLDSYSRANITAYLGSGGKLFLSGQRIGWDLCNKLSTSNEYATSSGTSQLWFDNTLGAQVVSENTCINSITGVTGDPIGDGLNFQILEWGTTIQYYSEGIISSGPNSNNTLLYNRGNYTNTIKNSQIMFNLDGMRINRTEIQVENSSISGSIQNDICALVNTSLTTVNCTFRSENVSASGGSIIAVKNFLHALVLNLTDNPINGANLTVEDNGVTIYNSSAGDSQTNINGEIYWILVTDRIYSSSVPIENTTSAEIHYLNYSFSCSPGPHNNINMNISHRETFKQSLSSAPAIELEVPMGGERLAGGSVFNIIWRNATDAEDGNTSLRISINGSQDGGMTWPSALSITSNLANGIDGNGSYAWTVPFVNCTTARLKVKVNDTSGVFSEAISAGNFIIDSERPDSGVNPVGTYWRNTATITIIATASDAYSGVAFVGLFYRFRVNNISSWSSYNLFGVNDTLSPFEWTFTWPNGPGIYEFYSIATDNAGNQEAAPTIADVGLAYDTTPGIQTITPIIPYWRIVSPVTITAIPSDTLSGVNNVALYYRFRANNASIFGSWTHFGTNDTTAPYQWSFNMPLGEGVYEFVTRVTDNAGNIEQMPASPEEDLGYDISDPTSSITPAMKYWQSSTLFTINSTVTDTISEILNVGLYYRYRPNNASTWTSFQPFGVNDTIAPYQWNFNWSNGQGIYEFYSIATDAANNIETVPTLADTGLWYDNSSPVSEVIWGAPYYRNTPIIDIITNFNDNQSGVAHIGLFYRHRGTNTTAFSAWTLFGTNQTVAPYTWTFNWPSGQGVYEIYTLAVDNASNIEAIPHSPDAEWNFDSLLPTINTMAPTGTNISPNSSVLFSFNEVMNHTSVYGSLSMSPYLDGTGGYFFNTGNYKDFNYSLFNKFYQNITYTITINSSIAKDLTGNLLDGNENGIAEGSPTDDVTWSFTTWKDWDGDGIPDVSDPDDDNDGVNDTEDDFPLDPDESVDTDGDGVGNNEDTDDDGDGVPDSEDLDPLDPAVSADTTAPAAPTGLTATVLEEDRIQIQWNSVIDLDLHHYTIYRSTDNITFEGIGNVGTGTTSYLDFDVVGGTTYYYKITAIDNEDNESPFSSTAKVTLADPIVDTPTDYTIYIIILIIVIVGVLGALLIFRKGRKPEPQQKTMDDELGKATDEAEADTGTRNV